MIRKISITLGVLATLLLMTDLAQAEPHFSLRSGLRCGRCHVSPAGGGKRTRYGALYAQTNLTLADSAPIREWPPKTSDEDVVGTFPVLATGDVTPWLAVGTDLRPSNQTIFTAEKQNTFKNSEGTLYLELRPWIDRVTIYLDEEFGSAGARNREMWGLVNGPWSTYLRVGHILPPYGLRILDDAAYTRLSTGANFANSDLGAEAGVEFGPLFFAVAVTNGNYASTDNDNFKTLYSLLEFNFYRWRAGASFMNSPSESGCRHMGGLFGGYRFGRLALQGEADFIADRPSDQSAHFYQFTWLGEADVQITKGLSLRAGYDYLDANIDRAQEKRHRYRFGLDFFPLRHVEAKVSYIVKQAQTGQPLDEADILEVMLHAYL